MEMACVWILYEPAIYADLFQCIFERLGIVKVIREVEPEDKSTEKAHLQQEMADVIILPLDDHGRPKTEMLPHPNPRAKLLAFSPDGEKGLRRLPGNNSWDELRPFGLSDLLFEVLQAS
jgi:hypothetical protein